MPADNNAMDGGIMDLATRNDMMMFSHDMGEAFESSVSRHASDPVEAMRRVCKSSRLAHETAHSLFGARVDDGGNCLVGDGMDEAMAEAKAVYAMSQMLAVESYVAGRAIAREKARRTKAEMAAKQAA